MHGENTLWNSYSGKEEVGLNATFVHNEIGDFSGDAFNVDYKLLETSTAPDSDSDNDGLPDIWEEQFFDNLDQTAEGDPDSDGLNNAEEFEAGTKPDDADSDGVGYADGVKTGTGTWVSAEKAELAQPRVTLMVMDLRTASKIQISDTMLKIQRVSQAQIQMKWTLMVTCSRWKRNCTR